MKKLIIVALAATLVLASGLVWWKTTNYGQLELSGDVSDVTIFINGELVANDDQVRRLAVGDYEVRAEKTNFRTFSQTVTIDRNKTTQLLLALNKMTPEDAFDQAHGGSPIGPGYRINKARYFDNDQWLAGVLAYPESTGVTSTIVVLHIVNGKWTLIFDGIVFEELRPVLPADLYNYLNTL